MHDNLSPGQGASLTLESVIRRTTSRPFRFKFSVLYITITGAVAYINGIANCQGSLPFDISSWIGVIMVALLWLEWFEESRYRNSPPRMIALGLLALRIILVEAIVALDCNRVAVYLYPMIPYSAYFAFGGRTSVFLSLFYVVFNIWRISQSEQLWYTNPDAASNMLALTFVMLFVPLIAHIIRRNDSHRQETEQLLADLEVSHRRLQAYTEQVAELSAAEERVRLARDIHDSLGHYLTAMHIQLEKALAYQERDPHESTQAILDAKMAVSEALRDIRLSVSALRSPESEFQLEEDLKKLVRSVDSPGLKVTLDLSGDEGLYSRSTRVALYRAAQEGLTNIQKHAQATHAFLRIVFDENAARMVLRDDGIGFEPERLSEIGTSSNNNFGLRGLRERLEMLRGNMQIKSSPNQGTVLMVEIPRVIESLESKGVR